MLLLVIIAVVNENLQFIKNDTWKIFFLYSYLLRAYSFDRNKFWTVTEFEHAQYFEYLSVCFIILHVSDVKTLFLNQLRILLLLMLPLLKFLDRSIASVFIIVVFTELKIQQLLLWICLIYSSIKVWMQLSATVSCLDILLAYIFISYIWSLPGLIQTGSDSPENSRALFPILKLKHFYFTGSNEDSP